MPFFRVIVKGTGIRVPDPDDEASIVGFYVTRSVRAESAEAAGRRACEIVRRDWASEKYASRNQGGPPMLSVDSVYGSTLLEHLRFKNTGGHAFYPQDTAAA